ncbi:acyl carrier protein [Roseovarius sp.]|uniref:acyl carrier protein n=1 Tax=Roseovarius sp. TaxID=1486281 RepID=UPI003A9864F3
MSHETQDLEQEIMQTLFQRLAKFPIKSGELTAETSLVADMSLDSINMMELLMEVEDTFDVSFPLNMMANVTTVQNLADQIKQLVENKS